MTTDPKIFQQHIKNCRLNIIDYQAIVQNLAVVRQRGKYVSDGCVLSSGPEWLVKDMVKEKFCREKGYGVDECRAVLISLFGDLKELILSGPYGLLKQHLIRRYETPFPNVGELIKFTRGIRPRIQYEQERPATERCGQGIVEKTDPEKGKVWLRLRDGRTIILRLWSDVRLKWSCVKAEEELNLSDEEDKIEKKKVVEVQPKKLEQSCPICLEKYDNEIVSWRAVGPCPHNRICAKCILKQFHFRKQKRCPYCAADWTNVIFTDDMTKKYSDFVIKDMIKDPVEGILFEDEETRDFFSTFTKLYCLFCQEQTAVYFELESLYACTISEIPDMGEKQINGLVSARSDSGGEKTCVWIGELFLQTTISDHEVNSFSVGKTFRLRINNIYKFKDSVDLPSRSLAYLTKAYDNLGKLLPRRRTRIPSTVDVGASVLAEVTEIVDIHKDPPSIKIRLRASEIFSNVEALNEHLKVEHGMQHCKLCVDALYLFVYEQRLHCPSDVHKHNKHGSAAPSKSKDFHPKCKFCKGRFFDREKLYEHMIDSYYCCQVCFSRTGVVFRTNDRLMEHMSRCHGRDSKDGLSLPDATDEYTGPDVYCFIEKQERAIDDILILKQQRRNRDKFRAMERRLGWKSIFSSSVRPMPVFNLEEIWPKRDELRSQLELHLQESNRLLDGLNKFWAGEVNGKTAFKYFVGKVLPYVPMVVFEDLLMIFLCTSRQNLYDIYKAWKKLPYDRQPMYDDFAKSFDENPEKMSNQPYERVVPRKNKPVPVRRVRATPGDDKRINVHTDPEVSIMEQKQSSSEMSPRYYDVSSVNNRFRKKKVSFEPTPPLHDMWDNEKSTCTPPPSKSLPRYREEDPFSHLPPDLKKDREIEAVQLEVNILGDRLSVCNYRKGGYNDFLVAVFDSTLKTLRQREAHARKERKCLRISLPLTSEGRKNKALALDISRRIEKPEDLLAWENLNELVSKDNADLLDLLPDYYMGKVDEHLNAWIESTIDELSENELYILATYLEEALVRFAGRNYSIDYTQVPARRYNRSSSFEERLYPRYHSRYLPSSRYSPPYRDYRVQHNSFYPRGLSPLYGSSHAANHYHGRDFRRKSAGIEENFRNGFETHWDRYDKGKRFGNLRYDNHRDQFDYAGWP